MNEIHIFTDGSTLNNQNKGKRVGGVGVFFGDDDFRNISYKLIESINHKVTNQVAELKACVNAIEKIISTELVMGKQIVLYTDSMYIVNSMSSWASNWKNNNWKKADGKVIENVNLMKKLYFLAKNMNVIFRHVKAHKKEPNKDTPEHKLWYGNYMADKLAVEGSNKN